MTDRPFEARIIDRKAEPTLAVHVVKPMAEIDMAATFGRELPRVFATAVESGAGIGGPPFGRYFSWGGETADFEIGIVVQHVPDGMPAIGDVAHGEIGVSELPAGSTAVATNWGSYQGLPGTYERLTAWIAEQGREIRGAPWESYVDDPGSVADPADLRTEVSFPVAGT